MIFETNLITFFYNLSDELPNVAAVIRVTMLEFDV